MIRDSVSTPSWSSSSRRLDSGLLLRPFRAPSSASWPRSPPPGRGGPGVVLSLDWTSGLDLGALVVSRAMGRTDGPQPMGRPMGRLLISVHRAMSISTRGPKGRVTQSTQPGPGGSTQRSNPHPYGIEMDSVGNRHCFSSQSAHSARPTRQLWPMLECKAERRSLPSRCFI